MARRISDKGASTFPLSSAEIHRFSTYFSAAQRKLRKTHVRPVPHQPFVWCERTSSSDSMEVGFFLIDVARTLDVPKCGF